MLHMDRLQSEKCFETEPKQCCSVSSRNVIDIIVIVIITVGWWHDFGNSGSSDDGKVLKSYM